MKKKKNTLLAMAEKYAISLLSEASGGAIAAPKTKSGEDAKKPDMPFSDRRAMLDSITRLLAIQHRIDPEEETDGISSLKELMNGNAKDTVNRGTTGLVFKQDAHTDEPADPIHTA